MANDSLPCLGCGGARGKGQTRCGPCAHARRKARGGYKGPLCAGCGSTVAGASAPDGEAMCRKCRDLRRAAWQAEGRTCTSCGHVTGRWQKAICLACEVSKAGVACDVYKCGRPVLAKGICSSHYAAQWRASAGLSMNGRGTWIEPKRRMAIYVRDAWLCGICGDPVDREAGVNEDRAPSLDHIVPRSVGGGHESENLRTAHRACNAGRGARV